MTCQGGSSISQPSPVASAPRPPSNSNVSRITSRRRGGSSSIRAPCALPRTDQHVFSNPLRPVSGFPAEDAIKRIRRLVNERLRVMGERMEVFEGHVTAVADLVERFHDCWPIGRAVQER